MKKKRPFTLIEVVTTLTLFSIMAIFVMSWFVSLSTIDSKLDKKRNSICNLIETQRTIDHLLDYARESGGSRPIFLSSYDRRGLESPGSLVFQFDNGVQNSPLFSGKVLGKLAHNPISKELIFLIWPLPSTIHPFPKERREIVLLERVEKAEFEFFHPQDFTKAVKPKEIGDTVPPEGWQKEWKQSYYTLPAQIKLTLKFVKEDKEMLMRFDLGQPIKIRGES